MIRISKLKNGMRLITDSDEKAQTVSIGVWVGVGARFETAENNGISHVLEHMAFKGTKTRSAYDISSAIENVGGIMNAYTGRDVTAYYVKVLKEDVALGIDLIADILQHSVMAPAELIKEQGVIVQEINMQNDTPDDLVFDYFNQAAYPDQPLGRSILGTAEKVQSFTSAHVLDYMRQNYQAANMVISAAGAVHHSDFLALCEKLFVEIGSNPAPIAVASRYQGGEKRVQKAHEQVNLVLGFEGVSYEHPDYYAANVLASILGGGMSSRLFQEIREKRGLVYSIYAFHSPESDTGTFGVYAGTGEEQVRELMPVLCDEIARLGSSLSEEELARAKAKLKARLLMRLENITAHAESNALDLLMRGRVISETELIQKIEAVQRSDLEALADRIFSGAPVLAALGPIQNLMSYEQIRERVCPVLN